MKYEIVESNTVNNSRLLHQNDEKKIVPIIPPPGPSRRSFGDPFGSDTADITAGMLPGMGGIQGRNLGDP